MGAIAACVLLLLLFLLSRLFSGSSSERPPLGTPDTVIVTLLDHESMSKDYIKKIEGNRQDYAARHGESAFLTAIAEGNDLLIN